MCVLLLLQCHAVIDLQPVHDAPLLSHHWVKHYLPTTWGKVQKIGFSNLPLLKSFCRFEKLKSKVSVGNICYVAVLIRYRFLVLIITQGDFSSFQGYFFSVPTIYLYILIMSFHRHPVYDSRKSTRSQRRL